jgi:hypothetical protein
MLTAIIVVCKLTTAALQNPGLSNFQPNEFHQRTTNSIDSIGRLSRGFAHAGPLIQQTGHEARKIHLHAKSHHQSASFIEPTTRP